MSLRKTLYVGIDPGSNTGVAFWYPNLKKMEVFSFTSHAEAILYLYDKFKPLDKSLIKFRIEDARLTTKFAKPLPAHLRPETNKGKEQGVGYVKAYSKDWEAFCNCIGIDYELLAPQQNKTKTKPEYFQALTGIRTKEGEHHKRDAGMLVVGI